jgi:flagellar basal body rod protein FlgG
MDGLEWTAAAMRAARAQLDLATHNLANASTDGYRKAVAHVALTAHGLARDPLTGRRPHDRTALRSRAARRGRLSGRRRLDARRRVHPQP